MSNTKTIKSFVNAIGMQFNLIPAGRFQMGSPTSEKGRGDEETQHAVTLTQPFYMGVYEVTQGEWESVMGTTIEDQRQKVLTWWQGVKRSNNLTDIGITESFARFYGEGHMNPMYYVSWNECQRFVDKLNSEYGTELRQKLGTDWEYSLPSESQWEYACRAGTTTPYSFGGTLNGDKANCNGEYPYGTETKGRNLGCTTEVGSYSPNAWELYDMHGNVWEWCSDWYGDYPTGSVTDPMGPTSGLLRGYRGGGWSNGAAACRSAFRNRNLPTYRNFSLGCRIAIVKNIN